MVKHPFVASVAVTLTLFLVGPAQADWSGAGPVTFIQYLRDSAGSGNTILALDGVTCPAGVNRFVIRDADTNAEDLDMMLRLLIASKLSESQVRLGYSVSLDPSFPLEPTECSVYGVRF